MREGWPNVGRAIRDAREVKKMSQVDLATQLCVSPAAVSRIESRGNLNIGMLRRIARALGSRTDVIVRYAEGLDRLDQETGLGQKREEVAALEQQVKKRAGRLGRSGKR